MIFDRIVIKNLFSYYGEQTFDLSGSTPEKNIVIIHGRNGHGKTNFLNCLKLLFHGSEDQNIRLIGLNSNNNNVRLSSKNYINGHPPYWEGIRNLLAVKKGAEDYYIKIDWLENGDKISAVRKWPLNLTSLSGELEVTLNSKLLESEEAVHFVENRLPPDLVPYFYFDGERIRELAEASDNSQLTLHIERLLDLRKVVDLKDQCVSALSELRKQYANYDLIQRELDLEAKKSTLVAERNKLSQQYEHIQLDLQQVESQLSKIARDLDRIFESGSRFDEEALRQEQKSIRSRLEESCHRFISVAIPISPLSVNLDLFRRAIARLAEALNDGSIEQKQLLDRLSRVLPEQLFGFPPHPAPRLSNSQERFYKDKIGDIFTKMSHGLNSDTFIKASIDRLQSLYDSSSRVLQLAEGLRFQSAEILSQIGRENREMNRLERELLNAGGLSKQEREKYELLKAERLKLESSKNDELGKLEQLKREIERADNQLIELEEDIKKTRNAIDRASRGQHKVILLEKSIRAFDAYRKALRERRRSAIEEKLNTHFSELMDSSGLIHRVILDEDFIPKYMDNAHKNIGRFSVSAGTKQLLATALLWALKEISNRPVPVVVDTPLARIDRRHQENLLKRFYPNVSEQVIILPTDSELDSEKLNLIRDHVYKEFQLENPTGVSSTVSLRS